MKIAASWPTVTPSTGSIPGRASTANRALALAPPRGWAGTRAAPAQATSPNAATSQRVARHPSQSPTSAPSGAPSTVDTVRPPVTIARARPRRSGLTMPLAAAPAVAM